VKWLIDEMLPPTTAAELNHRGHDAIHVNDLGLAGAADPVVFDAAVTQARIVVTENFADYATLLDQRLRHDQPAVPVVFVRKSDLPRRGALGMRLAERLHTWAASHPDPYLGVHWPEAVHRRFRAAEIRRFLEEVGDLQA
jgi:predicted nuclease of predicted toxin-antitoxin system